MISFHYKLLNKISKKLQLLLGASTVGVRAFVINEKNQILLIKHTYQPGWYLPGGGVKKNETAKAAILRELKEEIGLSTNVEPELFNVYHHQIAGVNDYPILYVVKKFTLTAVKCAEIATMQWFDHSNLPEDATPATKRRLAEFFQNESKSDRW